MSASGFRVSVVADSVWQGVRLTTFACRFPRVVLAEMNTHRAISKNAASSRAIPVGHFVSEVNRDPYIPGDLPDGPWCGNRAGMVATEPLDEATVVLAHDEFNRARAAAMRSADMLDSMGIHKQDVNRLLEPFQWVRWVGTATNWDNFFALRTDHRTYPPFRFLARAMWLAYTRSKPQKTWLHLPFITDADREAACTDEAEPKPDWFPSICSHKDDISTAEVFNLFAWSSARCARVSVRNFRTDDTDRRKDYETFLKLTTDRPVHSSPCEHPAFGTHHDLGPTMETHWRSNFRSPWCQFRKVVPQETVHKFDPPADAVAGWNVPDDVFGGTPGVDW